jgi:CRISPR/Cas system-associated protein endoribonuclease Cas2
MLYREIIAVSTEIHTKHIIPSSYRAVNTLCLGYKTSQLMLYREIIAVCSEIHTKHINTLCEQNVELLNVKLVVHIITTELQRVKSQS